MARRISLALAIHNHQPVGNFGWVFAEVFERAYEPLVAALERRPTIRCSLHYTGPLLEWLRTERPAFVERVVGLVARGQVELIGGGLYEPILASLPERDRHAQLVRMADELESLTGRRPRGAWLAERVWEPGLPSSLVGAGYEWTILDDEHFRAAAIREDDLWGAYTTEDQGHLLKVFGTEQRLRYLIPFGEVDEVIDHLRAHATERGERVGMMGDDGEKFGAWPTTWEHCWGRGRWMERFFDALEANASWLTTVTPSAWLQTHPPIGRVYVPTASYAEMGEWALPPDDAVSFQGLRERAVAERRPEARWLRGGFWRNFQVRYREINDLHKQMLRTSAKVAAMRRGPLREVAEDHLHRGQSNDGYWHGLFGGIYIGHMRAATLEHLIAAEDLADGAWRPGWKPTAALVDTDLDGIDEAFLAGPGQVVTVDLAEGAGIGAWDIRAVRHALASVVRRRPERYHEQLRRLEAGDGTTPPADAAADGVVSIHELAEVKEAGLADRLHVDAYERRSGLVRFLPLDTTPAGWAAGETPELADAVDAPWRVESIAPNRLVVARSTSVAQGRQRRRVRLRRTLTLGGTRRRPTLTLELEAENRSSAPVEARIGIEWALTMLGGGGNPSAWWQVRGRRTTHDASGTARGIRRLAQGNDYIGIEVRTLVSPAADAWWAPIETISGSEAGFERVYQGGALLLSWPVTLAPGERRTVRIEQRVVTARDRALEDVGAARARRAPRATSAPART